MTGQSKVDETFSSNLRPSSIPGPLKESIELLFALSKDPLKIQLILCSSVTFLNFSATCMTISSDSRTLTPPISVRGLLLAIVKFLNLISFI